MPPEEQKPIAEEENVQFPESASVDDTQPPTAPESASPQPESESALTPEPAPSAPQAETAPPAPKPDPIPVTNETVGFARLLARANEVLFGRKRRKLDRIVDLAVKQGQIRNNDVEKLLRVSDATATRYLTQLVHEGRLKHEGSPKQPHYRKP